MTDRVRGRLGGFTLMELIVVAAVMAILAALAFPAIARVVQAGKATACTANLGQIGAALQLYLNDHKMMMPTLQAGRTSTTQDIPVIDNTLNAYARDLRIFACPADNLGIAAGTGTSYFWDSLLNGQSSSNLHMMLSTGQNSEIPVVADKQGFHPYASNKVNVLYADGHASQDLVFVTSK